MRSDRTLSLALQSVLSVDQRSVRFAFENLVYPKPINMFIATNIEYAVLLKEHRQEDVLMKLRIYLLGCAGEILRHAKYIKWRYTKKFNSGHRVV